MVTYIICLIFFFVQCAAYYVHVIVNTFYLKEKANHDFSRLKK